MSGESELQSPHTPSIHTLDNDSLLNVFYLYRLSFLGKDDDVIARLEGEQQPWVNEYWWYKLIHVCQRHPVADMLAHSHSLPLVIDYFDEYRNIPAEVEQQAILALKQRDRVRCIRLDMSSTNLQKLVVAVEKEYPILEHLTIRHQIRDNTTFLMLPETLESPSLRHLMLVGFALPIGSQLLATAVHLVTLCLTNVPSTYLHPNTLLQWFSLMPKLEKLMISFFMAAPNHDEGMQLMHPPVMTPVTLPVLRYFWFQGHGSYLEALVHRITPCPEKLKIHLLNQSTFSFPALVQFMNTTENPKFEGIEFKFSGWHVSVAAYPRGETDMCSLSMTVSSWAFGWLASFVAQISNSFRPIFSAAERLALEPECEIDFALSREHELNGFIHIEWRQLLSSFSNVKILRIDNPFVEGVSRCLQLDDGEFRLEVLPELQEIAYCGGTTCDAFTSFIDARQKAGRPVTLTFFEDAPFSDSYEQ